MCGLCLYVHCSYTFGVPIYFALFLCVVCHCNMSIAVHTHVVLLLHVVFVVNIWWPIGYDGRLLCVLLFFAVPHGLFHFPASMLTFVLLACVLQKIVCWGLVEWCVVANVPYQLVYMLSIVLSVYVLHHVWLLVFYGVYFVFI